MLQAEWVGRKRERERERERGRNVSPRTSPSPSLSCGQATGRVIERERCVCESGILCVRESKLSPAIQWSRLFSGHGDFLSEVSRCVCVCVWNIVQGWDHCVSRQCVCHARKHISFLSVCFSSGCVVYSAV